MERIAYVPCHAHHSYGARLFVRRDNQLGSAHPRPRAASIDRNRRSSHQSCRHGIHARWLPRIARRNIQLPRHQRHQRRHAITHLLHQRVKHPSHGANRFQEKQLGRVGIVCFRRRLRKPQIS